MELHEIFEFNCYKEYLKFYLEDSKKRKRGSSSSLSKALNVHPSFISQVIKHNKDISMEHAYKITDIFDLKGLAKDYFILIFLKSKSSNMDLKKYFQDKSEKKKIKAKSNSLKSSKAITLPEEAREKFYSHVDYSFIHLLTSFERFNTAEKISKSLKLPLNYVKNILDFLESHELCIKDRNGYYNKGISKTYVSLNSPLSQTNHRNWRIKAFEFYPQVKESDLIFSGPMTISKSDFKDLKYQILELIRKVGRKIEEGEDHEIFAILNIDWISFREN